MFPDRSSPAGLASPTISPIVAHTAHTPIGSGKAFVLQLRTKYTTLKLKQNLTKILVRQGCDLMK